MDAELERLLERAREWERTATPEQKAAMREAQRQSFIRAMAPCEHGDYDWETCPECLAIYCPAPHPTPPKQPAPESKS